MMTHKMTREISRQSVEGVHQDILRAAEKRKITADTLIQKLQEELEAHENKVFQTKDGDLIYSDDLIAWKTRQEARKDAHKLLGHYPAEKLDISGDRPILIVSSPSNGKGNGAEKKSGTKKRA
jgi:hypothetical protein